VLRYQCLQGFLAISLMAKQYGKMAEFESLPLRQNPGPNHLRCS
jgi:hypothetical protein